MKLLVTGKNGQLARSLTERARQFPDFKLAAYGRPEMDLEERGSAAQAIKRFAPDIVVHTAAFTDVDGAEEQSVRAMRINGEAAGEVAEAAAALDAPIIHISTDYVFGGSDPNPLTEDAPTGPINAYGRSKLAGEEAVRAANAAHMILRTAWVYSPFGRNFVRTMFEAAGERDELRVISDKRGSPTAALDLADAILRVVHSWREGSRAGQSQTYHLAGSGDASWYELADQVMKERLRLGLSACPLVPIPASTWPMRALRPDFSVLDSRKFQSDFGFGLPPWRESVAHSVARLAADSKPLR